MRHFLLNRALPLLLVSLGLGACSSNAPIPSSGASRGQIEDAGKESALNSSELPIRLVDIDLPVVNKIQRVDKKTKFSEVFRGDPRAAYRIGTGDMVEVSLWEAPPAMLFNGAAGADVRTGASVPRVTTLPEQMVLYDGTISIPFAGSIPVAGRALQQVEADIVKRLKGKANQPQAIVRVTKNVASNVTVVGEVTQSTRMPLTPKGERLLDALAAAGGVRQPVTKTTIQVTRGDLVQAMALDNIIQDPKQNVVLQPGDVVTALFQPLSFTALGATGKNEEIFFEAQGITLAQALGRVGGVQDQRADAKGVFIFRFEDPSVTGAEGTSLVTPDGKTPVVYRMDLKDPRSFFVAQGFPMRNKDIVYVANAPAAELQKFLNILTSIAFAATGLGVVK